MESIVNRKRGRPRRQTEGLTPSVVLVEAKLDITSDDVEVTSTRPGDIKTARGMLKKNSPMMLQRNIAENLKLMFPEYISFV